MEEANETKSIRFKVRDLRIKEKFSMDDAYLNGWARYCGPDATLVYLCLCRHANFDTQQAYPAELLIADKVNITIRRVRKGIRSLKEYNIILVEQNKDKKGRFANYIYTLLDKSGWKKPEPYIKKPPTVIEAQKSSTVEQLPTYGQPYYGNSPTKVTNYQGDKQSMYSSSDEERDKPNKEEISNNETKKRRIVFLYAEKKNTQLRGSDQENSFFKRNSKPATELLPYSLEEIEETMNWLAENADYKWTLETVGKHINENLEELSERLTKGRGGFECPLGYRHLQGQVCGHDNIPEFNAAERITKLNS